MIAPVLLNHTAMHAGNLFSRLRSTTQPTHADHLQGTSCAHITKATGHERTLRSQGDKLVCTVPRLQAFFVPIIDGLAIAHTEDMMTGLAHIPVAICFLVL